MNIIKLVIADKKRKKILTKKKKNETSFISVELNDSSLLEI